MSLVKKDEMDVNDLSEEMVSRAKELCRYVLKKLMRAIKDPSARKKWAEVGVYKISIAYPNSDCSIRENRKLEWHG